MAESTDLFPPNGEAKYFWCAHWTRNCRDNPSGKSTDPPAAAIEASVGSNVDSKPILLPRAAACSIIASLGLSTGIGACSRATASMHGPKAEHVKRIASASGTGRVTSERQEAFGHCVGKPGERRLNRRNRMFQGMDESDGILFSPAAAPRVSSMTRRAAA
jgi:hypothetical protein